MINWFRVVTQEKPVVPTFLLSLRSLWLTAVKQSPSWAGLPVSTGWNTQNLAEKSY